MQILTSYISCEGIANIGPRYSVLQHLVFVSLCIGNRYTPSMILPN